MDLQEFVRMHLAALEADEVRFNLHIALLTSVAAEAPAVFSGWTLGAPGHCALRSPGRALLPGNLQNRECEQLARETIHDATTGVIGADDPPRWFAQHAASLGTQLGEPVPQRIHVLDRAPR